MTAHVARPAVVEQLWLPGYEVITEAQAAALLRSDVRTLRWWRREQMRSLTPYSRGRRWFYFKSEVDQLAASRKRA